MLQNREYYIKRVFICTGIVNFHEVHDFKFQENQKIPIHFPFRLFKNFKKTYLATEL